MNVPCYQCDEREVGCHSECGKYKEYIAENEQRKEEHRKNYAVNDVLYAYKKDKYSRLTGRKV